ncbi:DNA oxidative demethylase ALKBH2 isoform X3 [Apodemus sylvaticus]|uniref:DNA oxidative demethylase ALKBH2 isoform X3 n=1 Tax=Apodemus sylvaticus TaxID=10129 RepID=UPI002244B7FB|nr:DNA oxidative demethylase ALKBH2 isoform X3 [Apodemus sylvaticus]
MTVTGLSILTMKQEKQDVSEPCGGGGMDKFLVRPDPGDLQRGGEQPAPTGGASDDLQNPDWRHFRAEGALAKVQVFGKWHSVPRKQATYGDAGLTYTFSGLTLTPKPWIPVLERVRDRVCRVTGQTFNFVLVNRYKDGCDHIGEHRDDERELAPGSPIASVSFGACRDFLFRHKDSRGKRPRRTVEVVRLQLAHGSLLMMNHPTNAHWYHSLPVRKRVLAPRVNLTFRKILPTKK